MFLSQKGAKHVAMYPNNPDYKFSVVNHSISERIFMNAFWGYITDHFIPAWIVPNVLTLSGWAIMLIGWMLAVYGYYPNHLREYGMNMGETSSIESNVLRMVINFIQSDKLFLITGIIFFFYQTVDGCDGKQARKTKQCSPLGEILDHGVDANSMTIVMVNLLLLINMTPMTTYYTEGVEHTPLYYFITIYVFPVFLCWAFFVAHLNHYHTNIFIMDLLSATDIENFSIVLNLLRWYVGKTLFTTPLTFLPKIPESILTFLELPETHVFTIGDGLVLIFLIGAASSVIQLTIRSLIKSNRNQSPLIQSIPMVSFIILMTTYAYKHSHEEWMVRHYMTFMTLNMFGFSIVLFSLIVSRASIDRMHFEGLTFGILLPLVVLHLRDHFFAHMVNAVNLLIGVTIYVAAFYLHMGSSIIGSFCGALHINFLRRSVSKDKL
mmetsp:Transcript_7442/g.11016  ORF Transcript_7442/g.11016 Transcript_7442/m.11016 type:complete len:436 (+) Transcript_7442:32-1339(+)